MPLDARSSFNLESTYRSLVCVQEASTLVRLYGCADLSDSFVACLYNIISAKISQAGSIGELFKVNLLEF